MIKKKKKRKLAKNVWVEFFRPDKISDIILPTNYKKTFKKFIKEKEIPNMLLYSSRPGTGKTSLAKILCYEIEADYLYINVSEKGGIDTLRTRISTFASTKSLTGKPKIVILDEFEGASNNLQEGLRASIEQFTNICRFILTCNFVTRIIEPLKSRVQEFNMNYSDKSVRKEMEPQIKKRLKGILKFKEIEYKEDVLDKLIDINYPDMRKTIQMCQQYSQINGIIDSNIFNMEKVDSEFYQFILDRDYAKARRYMIESGYNYDEMFTKLFNDYVPLLEAKFQPTAILIIAEFMTKSSFSVDKELNFAAMLLELIGDLSDE